MYLRHNCVSVLPSLRVTHITHPEPSPSTFPILPHANSHNLVRAPRRRKRRTRPRGAIRLLPLLPLPRLRRRLSIIRQRIRRVVPAVSSEGGMTNSPSLDEVLAEADVFEVAHTRHLRMLALWTRWGRISRRAGYVNRLAVSFVSHWHSSLFRWCGLGLRSAPLRPARWPGSMYRVACPHPRRRCRLRARRA